MNPHQCTQTCISGHPDAKSTCKDGDVVYAYRKIRCHNRQIHKAKIHKGGIRKRNQTEYEIKGFRLFDHVSYKGWNHYFIFGRRKTGFFANDDTEGACGIVTECGPVSHDEAVKRMHDEAKKVIADHLKPASWDPDPVDMDKLGKELDKMGKDDESLRQFLNRDIIYCPKDEDNIMLLMQDTWCPSCMWSVKEIL